MRAAVSLKMTRLRLKNEVNSQNESTTAHGTSLGMSLVSVSFVLAA